MPTPTEREATPALTLLARHASRLTIATVPELVKRQASLCILDTIGCMIAGTQTQEAQLMLVCEPADAADHPITVPGTAERRRLQSALRVNAYLGDVLELNDLIGGHASIGNVTAAVALAQACGASGTALLEAVIRGIEVTTRVYAAVYPTLKRYTDVGMVPVGLPSAIGSAAAAARLLELNEEQTLNAMAIAGGLAGWCPAEVIFGQGGTMKPLLFGAQPAEAGVTAAHYARNGMTGPAGLLESKLGYIATTALGNHLDTGPWESDWALQQPRRKLHACCGYLHCAVDAVGKLRAEFGAALAQGRLEVRVPAYVADVVSKTAPPSSANDARFHLQYCLALAVCGNDVILPEHSIHFQTHFGKAEVRDAMARIEVIQDSALTHYHQCVIAFTADSGAQRTVTLSAPRGAPSEPLSDPQVIDKFLMLAQPVIGAQAAQRFVDAVTNLERCEDSHALMQLVAC